MLVVLATAEMVPHSHRPLHLSRRSLPTSAAENPEPPLMPTVPLAVTVTVPVVPDATSVVDDVLTGRYGPSRKLIVLSVHDKAPARTSLRGA
jgi:hypothetical protein